LVAFFGAQTQRAEGLNGLLVEGHTAIVLALQIAHYGQPAQCFCASNGIAQLIGIAQGGGVDLHAACKVAHHCGIGHGIGAVYVGFANKAVEAFKGTALRHARHGQQEEQQSYAPTHGHQACRRQALAISACLAA